MRATDLLPTLAFLASCVTTPPLVVVEAGPPAEADADTDVDTDADPMCSMDAASIDWEPARPGEEDQVRVRLKPDWDCTTLASALRARCEALKVTALPIWGADPHWYRSGADDPITAALVARLPPEAFVAFGS